jgi:hypothetical protein
MESSALGWEDPVKSGILGAFRNFLSSHELCGTPCTFMCDRQDRARQQQIPTHNVDERTAVFAKRGSGFSVQPLRRGTVRLLSFPVGLCDVQTSQTVLP